MNRIATAWLPRRESLCSPQPASAIREVRAWAEANAGRRLFSRFSPAARRVLRVAEQECRNHDHYYVGAEHMLYALLEEHDPAVEGALRDAAISSADVHAQVRRALGTGEGRTWEGILLTPRVRNIIKLAEGRAAERDI